MAEETNKSDASFTPDPRGQARRWQQEFAAARKWLEKWRKQGEKVVKRFRDDRGGENDRLVGRVRLNLYPSDVQTQRAMVYGKPPRVTASRRFADANDDVARVAALIYERMLNTDIELDGDGFCAALKNALSDRQLPGLGNIRIIFKAKFQTVPEQPAISEMDPTTMEVRELSPAVPAHEEVVPGSEDAKTVYTHWKDQLWGPSRVFGEVPWWAFKNPMSKEDLTKRFGKAIADLVPMNTKKSDAHAQKSDAEQAHPWERADVWEIYEKDTRCTYWYVEGFDRTLDKKEDQLELRDFWPFPEPMMANPTTDNFLPTPDYYLVQDQYNMIDELEERIRLLVKAMRLAGVYDETASGLKRLVTENASNELIPVPASVFASFMEKGGMSGAIAWLPIEQCANVLSQLRDMQRETIEKARQVSGMADIMRGQATTSGVTATEQGIKAAFGSVRMNALQDEFARFASDVQRIKAEVIALHFSPETIKQRSNIEFVGEDPRLVDEAIKLIKSRTDAFRIEVKPEAINMQDVAAQRQERGEYISALSGFVRELAPLATQFPAVVPMVLRIAQWGIAPLRGSSTIEGEFDRAVAAAEMAAKQPQPAQQQQDPRAQQEQAKLLQTQMKGAQEQEKVKAELNADLVRTQAETAAKREQEWNQAQANDWEKERQDARHPKALPFVRGPGP